MGVCQPVYVPVCACVWRDAEAARPAAIHRGALQGGDSAADVLSVSSYLGACGEHHQPDQILASWSHCVMPPGAGGVGSSPCAGKVTVAFFLMES